MRLHISLCVYVCVLRYRVCVDETNKRGIILRLTDRVSHFTLSLLLLSLFMCVRMCVFVYVCSCVCVHACVCVSVCPSGLHGHVTTFEAAVHGFGSVRDLIRVRREIKRKLVRESVYVCAWCLSLSAHTFRHGNLCKQTHPHPHPHPYVCTCCARFPYDDARTVGPPLKAKSGPYYEPRMGRCVSRLGGLLNGIDGSAC